MLELVSIEHLTIMRPDLRPIVAAGAITFGALLGACSGSSATAPTSTVPVPVSPVNNAVIAQNDPASGCSLLSGPDAARGFGFAVPYRWTAPSPATGVAGYELYVMKVGASAPTLDIQVAATSYTETDCNTFVTDGNLNDWQWRVRAKDLQGQYSDWSAWSTYQFAPCRLSDGTPCRLPG